MFQYPCFLIFTVLELAFWLVLTHDSFSFCWIFIIWFQLNKEILIDAVVHAVNEDYAEMANDFTRLGFLAKDTDVSPIIPALEAIWQNSVGKGLSDFNFRSVTGTSSCLHFSFQTLHSSFFILVFILNFMSASFLWFSICFQVILNAMFHEWVYCFMRICTSMSWRSFCNIGFSC